MNLLAVNFKLLFFACLLVGFLSDVVTAQELNRLRYGTTISTVNLPVWVAKESRLFPKHGLDPEVIMIQAGALTTLAIISGELQFSGAGERAYNKWLKPKDPLLAKRAVEAYANLFKPIPRVTDRGIQAVLEDLALSTAVPKELIDRPDYFRDNGPLEKLVTSGWIE